MVDLAFFSVGSVEVKEARSLWESEGHRRVSSLYYIISCKISLKLVVVVVKLVVVLCNTVST